MRGSEATEAIAFNVFFFAFFCHCEAMALPHMAVAISVLTFLSLRGNEATEAIAFPFLPLCFFCHCEAVPLSYTAVAISILTFICHRKRFNQHYLSCHCERSEAISSLRFPFFYCNHSKYALFQYLLKVHQNNYLFKFNR